MPVIKTHLFDVAAAKLGKTEQEKKLYSNDDDDVESFDNVLSKDRAHNRH